MPERWLLSTSEIERSVPCCEFFSEMGYRSLPVRV